MRESSSAAREYGDSGWIGIATPQANPTVEAEMRLLLPHTTLPVFTRSTSKQSDPTDRLRAYIERLDDAIDTFAGMPLDVVGFACTGSSYVVGRGREHEHIRQLEDKYALPVVTATRAIAEELELGRIRRLHIVAPYPESLCDAAGRYWSDCGIEVTAIERMDLGTNDTRAIYDIRSREVLAMLATVDPGGADAILLSGTGMPTLTALARSDLSVPLLSSNMCLAAALLRAISVWPNNRRATLESLIGPMSESAAAG